LWKEVVFLFIVKAFPSKLYRFKISQLEVCPTSKEVFLFVYLVATLVFEELEGDDLMVVIQCLAS